VIDVPALDKAWLLGGCVDWEGERGRESWSDTWGWLGGAGCLDVSCGFVYLGWRDLGGRVLLSEFRWAVARYMFQAHVLEHDYTPKAR
jgi:hypothetical protein